MRPRKTSAKEDSDSRNGSSSTSCLLPNISPGVLPWSIGVYNLYVDGSLFRSSDKFTARSFPLSDPSALPRVGRPSNRRNVFFPPPDRLSPTLRPIFSLQGGATTTGKPTTPLSRFHPSGPSKYSPISKKDKTDIDYDDNYYAYYDDYYYDDLNTTSNTGSLGTSTEKPKTKSLSKHGASGTKFNKPPTAFSKFHTGTFRFSSPTRETISRNNSPKKTTTKSPYRFRFTPADKRERTTRPTTVATTPSAGKKGSLADLIAQLGVQKNNNGNPSSNDVDSTREGRTFENSKTTIPFVRQTTKDSSDVRVRITNSTESTFAVGSVESSHSIKGKENKISSDFASIAFLSTTSESPFRTIEDSSSETTYTSNSQATPEPTVFRNEGKRVLEDEPPDENLTEDIPEPEGPSITNSFSSFLENIHIAVDPSLLPPGYSVEETITETAPEELEKYDKAEDPEHPEDTENPKPPTPTSKPKSETTTFDIFSKSTLEDIFSSIPQEDITSLLPFGYTSTESSFQSSVENVSTPTTTEEVSLKTEAGSVDTSSLPPPDFSSTTSTTQKVQNEVKQVDPASFLPPGYKSREETKTEDEEKRPGYKSAPETTTEKALPGVVVKDIDVSAFLPPGHKPKEEVREEAESPLLGPVVSTVDISKFLPPGYKSAPDTTTEKPLPGVVVKDINVSAFLPPGYKPKEEVREEAESPLLGPVVSTVDISKFLPPGIKSAPDTTTEKPLPGVVVKDVDTSAFFPPGYKLKEEPETKEEEKGESPTEAPATTRKVGPSGIVFPRRPKRPQFLRTTTTTSKPKRLGPPPIKPKIQNLFDRVKALATTKYQVPVVTERIKPGQSADIKEATTQSTTTTTTTSTTTEPTTTTPPRPTTPGICGSKCRLAASLRLVSGTEWQPELANRDTFEFQELANEIEAELDAFFRSSSISLWYDYVEIDSFNKGSVIVSYILSLSHIEADIDTKDLKERFNTDLEKVAHLLGNFTLDPEGTDFIVLPEGPINPPDDSQNFLIPEWLIAVIVIGLASFLFILIFGVVALVSRARVRKRTNAPLTEEFLNNLNALQVNGIDNYAMNGLYDMDPVWNEKYPEKTMKTPSSRGKGYNPEYNVNIYDSWRTDYSGPYTSSSANQSKRRTELDFDGKQFYKDDPYDF